MPPKSKQVIFSSEKAGLQANKPAKRCEQAGFVPFPRFVLYKKGLSAKAKLIAAFLYDHLKPGSNEATGSQDLIAVELELNKRTVQLAIQELYKHHIVMNITRMPNSRGGFYNVYAMRVYDYPELRDCSKIKSFTKTSDKCEKLSKTIQKKAKNGKLGVPQPSDTSICPDCRGTKWVVVKETKSSRRCTTCKTKPKIS